eukprot:2940057-Amphidinium_carterae.1
MNKQRGVPLLLDRPAVLQEVDAVSAYQGKGKGKKEKRKDSRGNGSGCWSKGDYKGRNGKGKEGERKGKQVDTCWTYSGVGHRLRERPGNRQSATPIHWTYDQE